MGLPRHQSQFEGGGNEADEEAGRREGRRRGQPAQCAIARYKEAKKTFRELGMVAGGRASRLFLPFSGICSWTVVAKLAAWGSNLGQAFD